MKIILSIIAVVVLLGVIYLFDQTLLNKPSQESEENLSVTPKVNSTENIQDSPSSINSVLNTKENLPPKFVNLIGPSTLKIGEVGIWNAQVIDPDGDSLKFVVRWEDEPSPEDIAYPFNWPPEYATAYSVPVFSHAYSKAGLYTVTFYAVDDFDVNHVVDQKVVVEVLRQ